MRQINTDLVSLVKVYYVQQTYKKINEQTTILYPSKPMLNGKIKHDRTTKANIKK